jgi:molybdate transport system ATP-binding protein
MIDVRVRKRFAARKDSSAFELDVHVKTSAPVAVLFGPSGAGKTLTLDSIAGFVTPDEGRIAIGEKVVFDLAGKVSAAPRERSCGYVFQNYALFPHMTLKENLAFAAERLPRLERSRRMAALLDQFHLGELTGRKPHELSGGQKQRASIARALLAAPKILLLDEPARGLDLSLREALREMLGEIRREYKTPIVLVTHDLDECLELADEMFVYQRGRVTQSGAPEDVVENPATEETARLLGMYNVIAAEIVAMDPGQNRSRLRAAPESEEGFEFAGPYFPGHLLGARLTVCVRMDRVFAQPRQNGGAPVELSEVSERLQTVRLHFKGGLAADMPRREWEANRHCRAWGVRIEPEWVRLVK